MRCIKLIATYLLVIVAPNIAFSAQEFKVKDGDVIPIVISSNDLTRITMTEGSRIEQVWGNKDDLEIQPDRERGQLYIKPITDNRSISFFIRDTEGATYTIVASQKNIPSETVILRPAVRKYTKGYYKNETYIEGINRLIKAMALGADANGYSISREDAPVRLWRDFDIRLVALYEGERLNGDIYALKNKRSESVVFHESEFLSFGEDVRAVALESLELLPGETTRVFVIRGVDGK